MTTERTVSSDGVTLAVREHGEPTAPTVVLVHGFPDTQRVWDEVVERLSSRFHVVTYDVRGAGGSTAPRGPRGYGMEHLVGDLAAVIDAVSPDRPVHLVGHDWGSIQLWAAVMDQGVAPRVASFTSINGPSVDHAGHWIRDGLRRGAVGRLGSQAFRSSYMQLFSTPVLGPFVMRRVARRMPRYLRRAEGIATRPGHPAETASDDAGRGVAMYAQNMRRRLMRPDASMTDVPVQLIVCRRDPFISTTLYEGIGRVSPRLWRREIEAKHWVQRSHPDVVARHITEFVDHIEGGAEMRSLGRAKTRAKGRRLDGALVVITGAGSGIGRATALAFAARGAEVVCADINEPGAARTAQLIGLTGRTAHPYEVDVADPSAMERFAKTVETEYGVPDVVVNNAGIGVAGPFLDTPLEEWQRVIDVNLWGVIHGARLFGRMMADRGEGGHIVNVSSAAAYTPSRTLPAYSTTKAAVLMFSECLRAELARYGIGVSAICPGVINTPITRATRFVGLSDEEQEERRRLAVRIYSRRNYGPEHVADAIVRAVLRNTAVVPVSPEAVLGRLGSRFSPNLMRVLAKLDVMDR